MKKIIILLFLVFCSTNVWATNYCTSSFSAVACWLFNEGSGSTVADSSGNSHSGTFNTTTWQNANLPSRSYIKNTASYAGSTGNVNGGTTTNLFPTNGTPWSMDVWVNLNSTVTGTQVRVMDKSSGSQGPSVQINISGGTGTIELAAAGGTQLVVITSTTMTLNAWHNIGISWDGSTTATNVHIYLDGVECAYGTQTNGATLTSFAGFNFLLGNRAINDAQVWKGFLTQMGLFNSILSGANFADIYTNGLIRSQIIMGGTVKVGGTVNI